MLNFPYHIVAYGGFHFLSVNFNQFLQKYLGHSCKNSKSGWTHKKYKMYILNMCIVITQVTNCIKPPSMCKPCLTCVPGAYM